MVKINGRTVGGNARNMSNEQAARVLKAKSEGKPVDQKAERTAKKAAADHYATEANAAQYRKSRR